jgi:hypothetical protein
MKTYLLFFIFVLSYLSCYSKRATCLGQPLPDDISAEGCLLFPLLFENSMSRRTEELKNENLTPDEIKKIKNGIESNIAIRNYFVFKCLNQAIRNEKCKKESDIYPSILP